MRNLFLTCNLLIGLLFMKVTALAVTSPTEAIHNLIERVTPGYGNQFKLELIESKQDIYEISSINGKVLLRGNNPVSLATAYNQYLKQYCKAQISWSGNQLDLPAKLPLPIKPVRNTINGKYRVYLNYCTISYTAAWWDWEKWQRELDYMAMNSINMPLTVVGLEAVWYNTLLKHGFSDKEIRHFLTGPAHSAWQWMQNIQDYGGPMPKSWIDSHVILGRQILQRELEFGMFPIQQGFSGYVPRELKEKYPNAKIQVQRSWCGFPGVAQLDPTDSLFQVIGRDFLEEEKKLYGTHGFYAADPFHESKPPVNTPEYLMKVGQAIHKVFKDFDKNAVWVMQALHMREPIVKAVPKDELLILDIIGYRSMKENAFWGYNGVVGNLHNYGGRNNMHGDLRWLASNQYAKAVKKSPNICGIGQFMESLDQNPVYYDLALEMPLYRDSINVKAWLDTYIERRYGKFSSSARQAWGLLLDGPYRKGTNGTEYSSIIAARPALDVKKSGPNDGFCIPYDSLLLYRAEELLLKDKNKLRGSASYRFDVIDVQRQIMSNLGQQIHRKAVQAFREKDKSAFKLHSTRFLNLLHDTDVLLRTNILYNFDKWLSDARKWGMTSEEKDILEQDATSIFTIWGPDVKPKIFDYGWKEWAGLIEGFYLPRWKMFYDMLQEHLNNGTDYSEADLPQVFGRETFRANDFYNRLADWELKYIHTSGKARTPLTVGDEINIAQYMYKKYLKLYKEYYR